MFLRILGPVLHGALDYLLAIAFLLAPQVLAFEHDAARVAQIIGVTYLGVSLLTRYPLGLVKWIPFPIHGVAETAMAIAWIVLPWVLGFGSRAAVTFFPAAGIALLVVVALTDYQASAARRHAGPERRRHLIDRRQRFLQVRIDHRTGPHDRRRYVGG